MNNQRLYSFGYNAFQQIGSNTKEIILIQCHTNVKDILLASWESTLILNDQGEIDMWGYKPPWFNDLTQLCKTKRIVSAFGDPTRLLGILDDEHHVSYVTKDGLQTNHTTAKAVVYFQDALYCLDDQGAVRRFVSGQKETVLTLPPVTAMAASPSHILFLTASYAPVYGLGSNRFSQLGMDYHQQASEEPVMVEYFCGLSHGDCVACGPFHSAVVLGGDLYTFGWSKDGRLGWGGANSQEESIALAVFLDVNDQPVEVNVVKVVCGAAHTLALDDEGKMWSCGSNKYGQLGRTIKDEFDSYFRRCTVFNSNEEKAIDCFAGHWDSFISTHL